MRTRLAKAAGPSSISWLRHKLGILAIKCGKPKWTYNDICSLDNATPRFKLQIRSLLTRSTTGAKRSLYAPKALPHKPLEINLLAVFARISNIRSADNSPLGIFDTVLLSACFEIGSDRHHALPDEGVLCLAPPHGQLDLNALHD